jgi:hypothetical protein
MKRFLMSWAIERRDGSTSFFSEVVDCESWEQEYTRRIGIQKGDGSGRYANKWRLVFLQEMQPAGNAVSDELQIALDTYDQ